MEVRKLHRSGSGWMAVPGAIWGPVDRLSWWRWLVLLTAVSQVGSSSQQLFSQGLAVERNREREWVIGRFPQREHPAELVVARWGEHAFEARDVTFHLNRTVDAMTLKGESLQQARAAALQFLVDRQVILDHHLGEAGWPGKSKLRMAEVARESELAAAGTDLESLLSDKQISRSFWKSELAWSVAWPEYIESTFDTERLQKYFDEHRRDFDGTQVRVAQVLYEVSSTQTREGAMQLAAEGKAQVERGLRTFEELVAEHSIAPSRQQAGDLGWIYRDQPMPETFSRISFGLQPGQIADPFASAFGVHLIKCLEIRPGKRQLGDVREEVLGRATLAEFQELARQAGEGLQVEFANDYPHYSLPQEIR